MMQITAFSAEFLQIPLCYQTLNISLANVELRVFREIYGTAPSHQMKILHMLVSQNLPILRLDVTCILQDPNVNEEISWRL